jgi:hypothetical protein
MLLLGLGSVAAFPGRSHGVDGKVIGATYCAAENNDPLGFQFASNGATNVSGGSLDLVCSLPRDNTTNTNGLSDLQIVVTDPTGHMSCVVFAYDANDNVFTAVEAQPDLIVGTKIFDFGSSLGFSVAKGHYEVRCTLDNNAILHSILVNEY